MLLNPGNDVHRIVYQSDAVVITACSIVLHMSRAEVLAVPWLTIWRGQQSCPSCPDYGWPLLVVRPYIRGLGERNDEIWGIGNWIACSQCPVDAAGFPPYHHRNAHM